MLQLLVYVSPTDQKDNHKQTSEFQSRKGNKLSLWMQRRHIGTVQEQRHSSFISVLDRGEWSNSWPPLPPALPQGNNLQYPLNKRAGGLQSWSGHFREKKKIYPAPAEVERNWTVQSTTWLLYWLSYLPQYLPDGRPLLAVCFSFICQTHIQPYAMMTSAYYHSKFQRFQIHSKCYLTWTKWNELM